MAPAPVVAIGGILVPQQLQAVAETGAAGACVLRGLGDDPSHTLTAWLRAWEQGRSASKRWGLPTLPRPTLPVCEERPPMGNHPPGALTEMP